MLKLWIAQGFGVGRIPYGPGTFGSIVGLGWFALLLNMRSFAPFIAGTVAGIALSVWLCGEGEKILRQKDPGSIVLDEIVAIPVCGLGWVWMQWRNSHILPTVEKFFSNWAVILLLFVLFRIFDIAKPWPIRKSQLLPGGWGVTVDDLLAAVYVNVLLSLAFLCGLKW